MELTFNGQIEPGYIKEVKDILENREFMQLGAFSHHQSTSRLMHSINVSYISWHIARKLGCDARMAARAGLLHDFCLYDFREKPPTGGFQAFYHPRVAARNSQEVFGISEREKRDPFPYVSSGAGAKEPGGVDHYHGRQDLCIHGILPYLYRPGAGPPGGGRRQQLIVPELRIPRYKENGRH